MKQMPMLSLALGEQSRDFLASLGYAIEWKPYPMQHEVCRREIDDIATWLTARLAPGTAA